MTIIVSIDLLDSMADTPLLNDIKLWLEAGHYIVNSITEVQDDLRPTNNTAGTATATPS